MPWGSNLGPTRRIETAHDFKVYFWNPLALGLQIQVLDDLLGGVFHLPRHSRPAFAAIGVPQYDGTQEPVLTACVMLPVQINKD